MENKLELLNQLAIISDQIEKANLKSISRTVIFELNENDFITTFNYLQTKYGRKLEKPNETFSITIGLVEFVFNTSNV